MDPEQDLTLCLDLTGAEPCRLALLVRYLSRSLKLYKALQGPAAAGDDPEAFKAASRLECHAQDCPPLPCEASRGFPEPDVQCLREAVSPLDKWLVLVEAFIAF